MVWKIFSKWENTAIDFRGQGRSVQTSVATYTDSTNKHAAPDSNKATGSSVGPAHKVPSESVASRIPGEPKGVPTALDKLFLVGSGRYKSRADIPRSVDGNVIHRARSWGRIRINIGFLFLAAILGGAMVYSGKQAQARGETIEKQNLDWHRQINEEHKRK